MDQAFEMICECLEQKRLLFLQYAEHTNQMTNCEIDRLEYYITERAHLATEIDKIDEEISALCDSDPEADLLHDAIANRGNFSDYSPEIKVIYKAAGQVIAVINGVFQQEPQVLVRMQNERDQLLEKIKGESNIPKVVKYVRGLASQPETGTYLGSRYDKV